MTGRIGRNMGRVELYAVLDKVKALQEAGYDFKKIHARLAESGQIRMSYSTFCFQMTKLA
jgi:intein-encoded DNA endonuclease-like protein